MANKKIVEDGVKLSLWLEADLVERIDRIATKARISKSRLCRNLIELALEDAEFLESFKLISLMAKIEDMKEKRRDQGLSEALPA